MRLVIAIAILFLSTAAQAQLYPDRYGYAWYPREYGIGYYRAPYYGGGLPQTCAYYGCYANRPAPRPVVRVQYWRMMPSGYRGWGAYRTWPRSWQGWSPGYLYYGPHTYRPFSYWQRNPYYRY